MTGFFGISSSIARLYRNDGDDSFTDISVWLDTNYKTAAAWGDYDNDGDLDILLTRSSGGSQIYENDGGSFTASIWLTGVMNGSVAWGDYDNDGDLDILLSGETSSPPYRVSKVYRNDAGSFTDIYAVLTDVDDSAVAWGDYDNDGDLDILLTGNDISTYIAKVYQNIGEDSFTEVPAITDTLAGVAIGSVAWGDYDNDGDLDILLTGFRGANIAKVYRNESVVPNNAPAAPTGLQADVYSDSVRFAWTIGTDTETDNLALSYNIRVGTTTGAEDLMATAANLATGYRRIPGLGNAQETHTGWWLYNLPDGTFYWSVQSIDHAFAGSAFAAEQTFEIAVPPATPQNLALGTYYDIGAAPLVWNRNTDLDILRYRIYMDSLTVPTTLVDSTGAPGDTSITITGLTPDTTYYFRIKAVDEGGRESFEFSNEVSITPAQYSLKTDSLALVDLSVSTNWASLDLTTPVSSWPGVTVTDGRVAKVILSGYFISGTIPSSIGNLISLTELRLNNNGLTSIPAEINNLTQLQELRLNDNQLVDLPDLTALTAYPLRVENNKLTFEDLVPNIPPVSSFRPQDSVGVAKDTSVEAGTSLTLTATVGGTGNTYRWKKGTSYMYDRENISGAYDDTLTIDPVREADSGSYICMTTNTGAYLLRIYSRPIHVTVINTAAPAAPQNPVAEAGDGQVTLTWDQNTEADFLRYRVYRGTAANPTTLVDSTSDITGITDTTKTLTGLTNYTAYYFRVTAVDVAGNVSGYSDGVSSTPVDLTAPSAPQNLVAVGGDGEVTLTWQSNSEEDFSRYYVYGGTPPIPVTVIDSTVSITDTTLTLTDLINDTAYWYRVTAVDTSGNESGYSNEVLATPYVLALDELQGVPTEFALHQNHPNPFNPTTTLRFDLPEATDVVLVIYDLLGQEVVRLVDSYLEPGYQQVVWDGRNRYGREVSSGIYIIRMLVPDALGRGLTPGYTRSIKTVLLK